MQAAAIPRNEPERLAALRDAGCAYMPREERFDRITRTVRRLLHVPMALVTVVEQDELWFRSVQGLHDDHISRDISFCAHVVASGRVFVVGDTWQHPAFVDNPLVIGEPGIRSYVGWPLEIAPGLVAGSLCAIDTLPRMFSDEELIGLKDLAHMAEAELRAKSAASLQKSLLMRLDLMQRRHALDPLTGCWTVRGFRELIGLAVPQARSDGSQLALVHLTLDGLDTIGAPGELGRASALAIAAQLLRERLPTEGALARLSDTEFCALLPAPTPFMLEQLLGPVLQPVLQGLMPDGKPLALGLRHRVVRLAQLDRGADASRFWASILIAPAG